jgi:hypothetical protein
LIVTDTPELVVHKMSAYVPISIEMAMDCGLISEAEARASGWTPTPIPPMPRWVRLRWRWQSFRERAGRRVGSWLAGVDLSEPDE